MSLASPSPDRPLLSIVIVSWNVRPLLAACIASLTDEAQSATEIIVVDNASADGTADWLRRERPGVRLVANRENLGFGRGNNAGLEIARGERILLLNPDTVVEPGAIEMLLAFMEAHPAAGMAAPRLLYADDRLQRNAFRFPGLAQVFLDLFPLHARLLESRVNGRYLGEGHAAPFEIDHPLGAAMMIRREVYEQAGGFDPVFFMYAEEVDWCWRIRSAGWEIWQVPTARIVHLAGQSTRQVVGPMYIELWRSRYRFFVKHHRRGFMLAARLIVRAGMLRKALAVTLDARRGRLTRGEARALRRIYGAVFRL
ncbi:MAG: glycosyltransferase family 2 protein [Chloroflexia bacterium]